MSEMVERVARANCANAFAGYCRNVGGSLGCRVGCGEKFDGTNCAASTAALVLSEHWAQALAGIVAMRDSTTAMDGAADKLCRQIDGVSVPGAPEMVWQALPPDRWRECPGSAGDMVWQAMIDEALR